MIHLIYMNIHALDDAEEFSKWLPLISSERREKITLMKNHDAAKRSLAVGILQQIALERMGAADNLIEYGSHGKPMIRGKNCYFNLSHSENFALCAYGDQPLGTDLQLIKDSLPKHTSKILSEEESAYLKQSFEPESDFYRLWARKEAAAKWDGRGLRIPFQSLSFVEKGCLCNHLQWEGKLLFLHEILWDEYVTCICAEKQEEEIIMEEIIGNH